MYYYISDMHLNCVNKHDGRTLETDKILKQNWNSVVTNSDTVYILGDIGKEGNNSDIEYLCSIISTLKGKKVLIKGNHEKIKDARLKQLFTEICDYKEIEDHIKGATYKLVLSHYPILFWNGQHKGWIHLYGHVHKTEEWYVYKTSLQFLNDFFKEKTKKGYTDCPEAKAYNVGCMLWNNTPVTLEQILKQEQTTGVDNKCEIF